MTIDHENNNRLENITLKKLQNKIFLNEMISLDLSLKIDGAIRDSFVPSTWERAYNKFDNTFRIAFNVELKSGRKILHSLKFVRKAIFFWTRSPKISHRIWISIVKDDSPFYPESETDARSLLFDINKILEFKSPVIMKEGKHRLYAEVKVSWGKHNFTEPTKINGKSNEEEIELVI